MCSLPFPAVGQRVHLAQQKIPHPKIAHQHDVNVFVELCLDPPDSSKTPAPAVLHIWGALGHSLPSTWRYLKERSAGGHDPQPHESSPASPWINHLQLALRKQHMENQRHQHWHSPRLSIPPADVPPVTPGGGGGCRGVGGHCSVGKRSPPSPALLLLPGPPG